MDDLIGYIIGTLIAITVLFFVVRKVRRDSESDLDLIRKQLNCPHLYFIWENGERLCGACGKELPLRRQDPW